MVRSKDATLNVFGDVLFVTWTGSVWQSPTTSSQHSHAADAMRVELESYLSASGEDMDSDDTDELIDDLLSNIVLA